MEYIKLGLWLLLLVGCGFGLHFLIEHAHASAMDAIKQKELDDMVLGAPVASEPVAEPEPEVAPARLIDTTESLVAGDEPVVVKPKRTRRAKTVTPTP